MEPEVKSLKEAKAQIYRLEQQMKWVERDRDTAKNAMESAEKKYQTIKAVIQVAMKRDEFIYRGDEELPEKTVARVFMDYAELRGRTTNLMDENENLTDLLRTAIVGYPKPENVRETNPNLSNEPSRPRRNF